MILSTDMCTHICPGFIYFVRIKYPDSMHLNQEMVCFSLQFQVIVTYHREFTMAVPWSRNSHHIHDKRNEWINDHLLACVQLGLSTLMKSRYLCVEKGALPVFWVFPHQLTWLREVHRPTHADHLSFIETVFPGDSMSCQVDH